MSTTVNCVPRIPDEFLECVAYLYPSGWEARAAERAGGTGFLLSVPVTDELSVTYLVTNSHVAVNARAVRLNTEEGTTHVIELEVDRWVHHPAGDDLAILAFGLPARGLRFKRLPRSYILTREEFLEHNVGVGDDVYFMGRFIAHDGKQRNQPVARFGAIAMMPGEPVHQKERGFDQESFLVEARSLGGFSGSPVMLHIPPFSPRFRTGTHGPDPEGASASVTTALIGVDWGSMRLDEATNTGIMGVVPVWKLEELLDDEEVRQAREDGVAAYLAAGGTTTG